MSRKKRKSKHRKQQDRTAPQDPRPHSTTETPSILAPESKLDIRKRLPERTGSSMLCVYAPCTWPFLYRKFVVSLLGILSFENILALRQYNIERYMVDLRTSFPICRNRNEAVLRALKQGADYILFLDADMIHPPDIAQKLLSYRLPVVAGIYFHQSPPNLPVIYRLSEEDRPGYRKGTIYKHFVDYPRDKLFTVDLTGMGCMLVDTRIFSEMDLPYFGYGSSNNTGIVDITEDVMFCEKVRKAGFDIVIDPSVIYNGDIGEDIFNAFMTKYKDYSEILKRFGDEEGDFFNADKL